MRIVHATLRLVAVAVTTTALADAPVDFIQEVWPILHERCHACHGAGVQEGELRLDVPTEGLPNVVQEGDSAASELLARVSSKDEQDRMPPKGEPLSADEVALLSRWIDSGAHWPDSLPAETSGDSKSHWAWKPIELGTLPSPKRQEDLTTPVDAFLQARLEREGRSLSPPADRRTVFRRLTYDLVGLPPTPEEMADFLADDSPDAFEAAVDRLLASPCYGERWGRHWMDVVRYADTAGDNADYPVPEARHYRDYIIDAFNRDKPYDEFVVEQLSGDLLAEGQPDDAYAARIIATGFVALSRRYATAPFELMHLTLEDAIDTTGRTFLGLTLRCARCHDHKFDPITQEDYYGLYGIFASTRFPYAGSEEFQSKKRPRTGFVPIQKPGEIGDKLAAYEREVQELKQAEERLKEEIKSAGDDAERKKKGEDALKRAEKELRRRVMRGSPFDLAVAYGVQDAAPADQPIQTRGEPNETGPVAPRRTPRFFSGDTPLAIAGPHSGRLELAQWIAAPTNPLSARVMVNRIWQHHFGQGLVRTSSNFGKLGEAPSHPELLDWLASEFIAGDWSIKRMHRLIVTSSAWRQRSEPNGTFDPLMGRYARRRLDAESIRDAMMLVANNLDLRQPPPHPFPDIGDWHWTQHQPFKEVYATPHRSVYLMRQRIQRHPFLVLFDAPDANVSTDVRTSAIMPQQALFLMNDPFVREQSEAVARQIMAQEDSARVGWAIEHLWSRPATRAEIDAGTNYIKRFVNLAGSAEPEGKNAELEAWTSYVRVLLASNEFFWVD